MIFSSADRCVLSHAYNILVLINIKLIKNTFNMKYHGNRVCFFYHSTENCFESIVKTRARDIIPINVCKSYLVSWFRTA